MKVLITGGGSGGHVSPALAVAQHLQLHYPDVQLLYIGGTLTMEGSTGPSVEQRLVSQTNIPFKAISAGKLKRDGLSLTTLKRLWGVVPGFFEAFTEVRRFNPHVIFSSGGYVSLPVVITGWMQGKPIIIHEQTAAVGLANKIAAKFATQIAITFPQSAKYFNQAKVILTGNPLNQAISQPVPTSKLDKDFLAWLKNDQKPLIYITGGGLGSHVINVAVEQALSQLLQSYRLLHQTGDNQHYADYDRLTKAQQQLDKSLANRYWPVKHLSAEQIGHIYQQAAVVVARAGANTVLELAFCGKPAIFIPIPWVTHDEQTKNAQALVEAGTGRIVPEHTLSPQTLIQVIDQSVATKPTATQIKQARQLVKQDATARLSQLIVDLASP